MTWLVESFDVRTDELLAEIDLDALASDAVERLIGALPEALAPDQVRVVAPLFDIDPEQWRTVVQSSIAVGSPDADWFTIALVRLVSEVVQVSPEELGPAAYPISLEAAQGLLNRFSSDVRVPPGGVFLDLVAS